MYLIKLSCDRAKGAALDSNDGESKRRRQQRKRSAFLGYLFVLGFFAVSLPLFGDGGAAAADNHGRQRGERHTLATL